MALSVKEAVEKRRSYRAIEPADITDAMVEELARAASLAPSCFNKQPWRFIFVREPDMLKQMHGALSEGNEWARNGPMILAVLSKKELDCVIRDREYYLFDTGLAVGQMMLMATGMGLVAHPMAGFSPKKTREILGIPEDMAVITLIAFGKRSAKKTENMSDEDWDAEEPRPERLGFPDFAYLDRYGGKGV